MVAGPASATICSIVSLSRGASGLVSAAEEPQVPHLRPRACGAWKVDMAVKAAVAAEAAGEWEELRRHLRMCDSHVLVCMATLHSAESLGCCRSLWTLVLECLTLLRMIRLCNSGCDMVNIQKHLSRAIG
jgi:hypothetical protein